MVFVRQLGHFWVVYWKGISMMCYMILYFSSPGINMSVDVDNKYKVKFYKIIFTFTCHWLRDIRNDFENEKI